MIQRINNVLLKSDEDHYGSEKITNKQLRHKICVVVPTVTDFALLILVLWDLVEEDIFSIHFKTFTDVEIL